MTRDRTISIAGLVLAALYLYATTQLQVRESSVGDPLGPTAFPILLGIALAAVSVFLLTKSVTSREDTRSQEDHETDTPPRSTLAIVGGTAISALIYVSVLDLVGFVSATFILTLTVLFTFNRHKMLINVIVATVFTASLYLLFYWFLGIALPVAPLFAQ